MIVVDTSAWIENLRRTESSVDLRLTSLLEERPGELAVTEVVVGELLAGVTQAAVRRVRDHLLGLRILHLRGMYDFELAASLARTCRDRGETVRQFTDCLVAVVAIRAGATLLHADRDFEKLERDTPLRLEPV